MATFPVLLLLLAGAAAGTLMNKFCPRPLPETLEHWLGEQEYDRMGGTRWKPRLPCTEGDIPSLVRAARVCLGAVAAIIESHPPLLKLLLIEHFGLDEPLRWVPSCRFKDNSTRDLFQSRLSRVLHPYFLLDDPLAPPPPPPIPFAMEEEDEETPINSTCIPLLLFDSIGNQNPRLRHLIWDSDGNVVWPTKVPRAQLRFHRHGWNGPQFNLEVYI